MTSPSLSTQIKINDKFYTYFACGAQSKAYQHGDTVVKIPFTPEELVSNSKKLLHGDPLSPAKAQAMFNDWIGQIGEFRKRLDSGNLDPALFADLKIDQQNRIFQKKVLMIEDEMNPKDLKNHEAVKNLIDEFADIQLRLWGLRACEIECSLFRNYARDPDSQRLVVPDIGSVSFNRERVISSIGQPFTVREAVIYMKDIPVIPPEGVPEWFSKGEVREALRPYPKLLGYYVTKMSATLTKSRLDLLWPKDAV